MSLIKHNILLLCILVSQVYPQVGLQITQNTSIANGEQTTSLFSTTTTDYKINENLFDINATYKNFYIYSQLEYSDPPVFGASKTSREDLLNLFSIEYNGIFNLKLGDIHTIESRGLVFNSYQDQSTDFDNGIFGVKASYGKDWFDVSFIHGSDEYEFRSNPVNQLNDFSYDHTTTYLSTSIYPTDNIYLNLQLQNQSIDISDNVILDYYGRNFTTMLGRYLILNQQGFQNDQIESYNVNSDVLGLSFETNIYGIDIYSEYVKNKYTKLEPDVRNGQQIDGSLFYGSLYADVLGNGITYEFKRYDTPYFIPTLSYGPIVYREATSTLQSKVVHNMNFVNELGHQLDINRMVGDNINLNFNLSTARRIEPFDGLLNYTNTVFDSTSFLNDYQNNPETTISQFNQYLDTSSTGSRIYTYETPDLMSILFMDEDENVLSFWPYRQLYLGFSGDFLDNRLYFSIGYDLFDHIKQWGSETDYGMTRNMYQISGVYDSTGTNTLNEFIDSYWQTEYLSWDEDAYWQSFDIWLSLGLDSLSSHIAAESEVGFNIDNYNNIDNLISNSQEEVIDSVYAATPTNSKWFYESENAVTIPISTAWTFDNGNSVLLYAEQQWREKISNKDIRYISGFIDTESSSLEKFNEQYISLTFKHINLGTFTATYNAETRVLTSSGPRLEDSKNWSGFQWTYDFHQKFSNNNLSKYLLGDSRLSIFYGSQKGGLVCANGICATQPEFLNGFKLNYTRLF